MQKSSSDAAADGDNNPLTKLKRQKIHPKY